MKALILAAGLGTRLKPITDTVPKCMVEVNGVSIIQKQLRNLIDNKITEIYIVAGYKSDVLKKHVDQNGLNEIVKIIENGIYDKTNNMYSLYLGKEYVCGNEFLLMNGDVFFENEVITKLLENPIPNMIVCERDTFIEESMKISVQQGAICSISKSISRKNCYGTSIDVYKFSADASCMLFAIIEEIMFIQKDINSWSEVAIDKLLKARIFEPLDMKYKWVEIDSHDDLALAESLFR